MNLSKIIIGTSAWGSKISYKDALDIGSRLIDIGLISFDTGPHYGSGYAHHILNELSFKKKIFVDTKFGDSSVYSVKEIFKRIYRYRNYKNFLKSFQYLELAKKNKLNLDYWKPKKLFSKIKFFESDLCNSNLDTIYLHNPPENLITKDYLNEIQNYLKDKNLKLGVSSPNTKDFFLIQNEYPEINLQISLNFYQLHKNKIINNKNKIYINSLFKHNNLNGKNYIELDFINEIIQHLLNFNINFKLVIGINSKKSFFKLKEFLHI